MEKKYICICGREFKSQKSLSAHMASCKEYYLQRDGNLDVYNNRLLHISQQAKTQNVEYNKIRKEQSNKKKEERLRKWVSEKHRCECCGKVMTEFYGSGRFCSKGCANSRKHSQETKNKISESILNNLYKDKKIIREIKYCKICGKELFKNNKCGYCINCYLKLPKTEESKKKQSITMKNKGYPRWHIHRNEPSYAEKFFMKVLNNNNIDYEFDYHVKNHKKFYYILDFYISKEEIKIDLEIDGKQHEWIERIEHDKERDKYLKSKGYIVYRIKWNEINSDTGKKLMKEKIDKFLEFYNTC